MRLEHLEHLVAIAQYHSISWAAENLFMSNQALGASLRSFEDELGFPLFKRNYKGVELTENGEIMLTFARRMLAEYQSTLDKIHANLNQTVSLYGTLNVYAIPTFFNFYFNKISKQYCHQYPDVMLNAYPYDPDEIYPLLDRENIAGKNSIAIVLSDSSHSLPKFINKNYNIFPLGEVAIYFICRNDAKIGRKHSCLSELAKEPFIVMNGSPNHMDYLLKSLQKVFDQPLNIKMAGASFTTFLDIIYQKNYIGIIWDFADEKKSYFANLPKNLGLKVLVKRSTTGMWHVLIPKNHSALEQSFFNCLTHVLASETSSA